MYEWKNFCPLSSKDAMRAMKKGVEILALYPKKTIPVKNRRDIVTHRRKGGILAANRDALIRSESYFVARYILYPVVDDPEERIIEERKFDSWNEAYESCRTILAYIVKKHNIEDGEYWTEYALEQYEFGRYKETTKYDEAFVPVKDGAVFSVPSDFWLPF